MKDNAGSNDAPYHSCNIWCYNLKENIQLVCSIAIPEVKG